MGLSVASTVNIYNEETTFIKRPSNISYEKGEFLFPFFILTCVSIVMIQHQGILSLILREKESLGDLAVSHFGRKVGFSSGWFDN